MSLQLHISSQTKVPKGLLAGLRRQVGQALKLLDISQGSWSITLVDDATMIELHGRTMGLPTTTDVLTFDMREKGSRGKKNSEFRVQRSAFVLDLDTVICFDEAARRALELGHPLLHEVLLYAIHSLLHVCSYDDRTAVQARKMHKKEDEILTSLKIGPVYK